MNITLEVAKEDLDHIFACVINAEDLVKKYKHVDIVWLRKELQKGLAIIQHIKNINQEIYHDPQR